MAHLHLKKYVASNPHALGLHTSTFGIEEYLYVSGDECDVVFDLPDGNSAVVEVKDGRGAKGELVKGIYQVVKYRALMVAEKGQGANYPVDAYLVAYQIPADIVQHASKFGIECRTIEPL